VTVVVDFLKKATDVGCLSVLGKRTKKSKEQPTYFETTLLLSTNQPRSHLQLIDIITTVDMTRAY
jgi:hypothetical protein